MNFETHLGSFELVKRVRVTYYSTNVCQCLQIKLIYVILTFSPRAHLISALRNLCLIQKQTTHIYTHSLS